MTIYRKFILVLFLVTAIIVILIAMFFINQDFNEFVLYSLYGEEETVYSSGYSIKAWKEINIDDTVEDVKKILGEPLFETYENDGLTRYFYSKQGPKNTNYRVRIIVFDKDEKKVLQKIREFYLD